MKSHASGRRRASQSDWSVPNSPKAPSASHDRLRLLGHRAHPFPSCRPRVAEGLVTQEPAQARLAEYLEQPSIWLSCASSDAVFRSSASSSHENAMPRSAGSVTGGVPGRKMSNCSSEGTTSATKAGVCVA